MTRPVDKPRVERRLELPVGDGTLIDGEVVVGTVTGPKPIPGGRYRCEKCGTSMRLREIVTPSGRELFACSTCLPREVTAP